MYRYMEQKVQYQRINGKGLRNCEERWAFIKEHIVEKYQLSLDIGSAEGVLSKHILDTLTKSSVVSVECSPHCLERQKHHLKNYIASKRLLLHETRLDENHDIINRGRIYDNSLLLSVLHWFPVAIANKILKKVYDCSLVTFVELPNLDCKGSYNQKYLKYIKNEFGTIDNYIKKITGGHELSSKTVKSHTGIDRTIYVLKNQSLLDRTIHPSKLLYGHYDIYVKYMYIKSVLETIGTNGATRNDNIYRDIYQNLLKHWNGFREDKKRSWEDFDNAFLFLINDFKNHNFNSLKSPVPISYRNETELFANNGAHRVACALYFDRYVFTKVANSGLANWDRKFFLRSGMKPEYIDIIDKNIVKYIHNEN